MLEKKLTIVNKLGMHARAATCLVQLCEEFDEEITLLRDDVQADARSILELLMLEAPCGTEVTLRVSGSDEESEAEVVESIEKLFQQGFYENKPISS